MDVLRKNDSCVISGGWHEGKLSPSDPILARGGCCPQLLDNEIEITGWLADRYYRRHISSVV